MYNLFSYSVILPLLLIIFCYYWHFFNGQGAEMRFRENIFLFFGITSSPDHFNQRQSLRETWLLDLPRSSRYRFLIGTNLCDIHPMDRTSQFTCENLNFSIPENASENTMIDAHSKTSTLHNDTLEAAVGFSFHVEHPITVHYLGVKRIPPSSTSSSIIRVDLLIYETLNHISSVTLDYDSLISVGSSERGYIYKRIKDPVYLPKGFQGIIRVEGIRPFSLNGSCRFYSDWNHGNLVSVLNLLSTEPNKTLDTSCLLPSFRFTINDLNELKNTINGEEERRKNWQNMNKHLFQKLQIEATTHKDILFLDMIDVYRNLPKKVLLFIQWVNRNYKAKYVLKTDDDVFIDVTSVHKDLETVDNGEWDWWSCLRVGWPVQRHGKWRETVYNKDVYPQFPSGAGYVLTHQVVEWLSARGDSLSTRYQGEDVTMGIWLEAIKPRARLSHYCQWACDTQTSHSHCNIMELTVEKMHHWWQQLVAERKSHDDN